MIFFPIAKINLGLNVVSKRPDGYHNIETVFYPVHGIHDELRIEKSDEPGVHLTVTVDSDTFKEQEFCPPEKNLVVKAYNLLKHDFDLPGVDIHLHKGIPSQAGMGGGSSDGAYMIRALNQLCGLSIPKDQMLEYAAKLGADCPFFITPVISYADGIGNNLEPLEPHVIKHLMYDYKRRGDEMTGTMRSLVLVKPDVAVSTKEAYEGITPYTPKRSCRGIVINEPVKNWPGLLTNDFEDIIFQTLPILKEVKHQLYDDGALYASMSGSGSTIYGIFNRESLETNYSTIISHYAQYYHKIVSL